MWNYEIIENDFPLSAWHLAAAIVYDNLFAEHYRNKEYSIWNERALNSESWSVTVWESSLTTSCFWSLCILGDNNP